MKTLYREKLIEDLKNPGNTPAVEIKPHKSEAIYHQYSILVIDDEPQVHNFLKTILGDDGFIVKSVQSVREAISFLQTNPDIAVIICDLIMPVDDGFVMLKYMRTSLRHKNIPVIISTSCANEGFVKYAVELGAAAYINKPYSGAMITDRIKKVIDENCCKILVVSDEKLLPEIFRRSLHNKLYNINQVTNGAEAFAFLKDQDVNLIISELVLDDMTGLDLMSDLYKTNKWFPILFLGDQNLRVSEIDIKAAGGHGIINRPFNNTAIREKINKLTTSINQR